MRIETYEQLDQAIEEIGFLAFASEGGAALFSLAEMTDNVWHQDGDYDPWSWRMRVAQEGKHAYGKFFFGKAGFVCSRLVADFACARRRGADAREMYEQGLLSCATFAMWNCFEEQPNWTYHQLKTASGMRQSKAYWFDKSLVELQNLFLICISGQTHRINRHGQPYGWPSNDFARMDSLFPQISTLAPNYNDACAHIRQVIDRHGHFDPARIDRLITGI